MYANEEGKFFLSELNPENSITGNVVFDLNAETANASGHYKYKPVFGEHKRKNKLGLISCLCIDITLVLSQKKLR